MNTIELFCGTKSFSKVAAERGHSTFTVDNDPQFEPDKCASVRDFAPSDFLEPKLDILWASPPCTCFSVASIGKHWGGGFRRYKPRTQGARDAQRLVRHTLWLTHAAKWWFIENPRGVLRKLSFMQDLPRRVTVTYCQYGDTRMKPTDIWTNVPEEIWTPRPMCKNGAPCHEAAPRGSRTGTQGLKGAKERGVIPPALFHEIFDSLESI